MRGMLQSGGSWLCCRAFCVAPGHWIGNGAPSELHEAAMSIDGEAPSGGGQREGGRVWDWMVLRSSAVCCSWREVAGAVTTVWFGSITLGPLR